MSLRKKLVENAAKILEGIPASLKQYIEQMNVLGITFAYTSDGIVHAVCEDGSMLELQVAGHDMLSISDHKVFAS